MASQRSVNSADPELEDHTEDAILTSLLYLVKDSLHSIEKPYEVRYDTKGVIPNTNMSNESKNVHIYDFRSRADVKTLHDLGFATAKIKNQLSPAEFDDVAKVEELYYPEVENLLWSQFPDASDIKVLEHFIRKRDAEFPAVLEISKPVDFAQPARGVHIDFSPSSASRTALAAFDIPTDKYSRVATFNVWKSINHHGNDWPLALCDSRTIDFRSDSVNADVVFHNRFIENQRFYYSPKHMWYYFKDLEDYEVLLFRQTDSEIEGGGGVAHASFYNPKSDKTAEPRVSIEVRAFVFFI